MSAPKHEWLRPSALPKLSLCGHYRGEKDAGEAANRGTRLDVAFRSMICMENTSIAGMDDQERKALKWSVATANALACGSALEAREDELRIEAAGMTGTADLLCVLGNWSADLKTGMIRDYRSQQAAYALGFMDKFFVEEWTVHLLYCDAEVVETLRFTYEEAEACVHDALALYNGGVPPQANEYCSWCASRFTCPARRESLGIVPDFQAIDFANCESARLAQFVRAAKVVEEFSEKARAEVTLRMTGGEKIPGVTLTANGKVTRVVKSDALLPLVDKIDTAKLVSLCGSLSESKAKELLGDDFSDSLVTESRGAAYVTVRAVKP